MGNEIMETNVLDQGYVRLIETWGSDERIIEAARMSTAKGFLGWGPMCKHCRVTRSQESDAVDGYVCVDGRSQHEWGDGDEKLLKFLWDNGHATPFEMAGLTVEVKAPLMVFREWHRHRTQSYNEMSARYIPLPNEDYVPSVERLMLNAQTANKQAQGTGAVLTEEAAAAWLWGLREVQEQAQRVYEHGLALGVPKELARLPVAVSRYSVMRASANLRNWLAFLKLRCNPAAQWEIRQYADAIAGMIFAKFPRTHEVSKGSFAR